MGGKQRSVPARPVKKGGHSFLKGPKQAGVKKTKGGKLTSVKNQIRGVRRLLSKNTLDQKIRRGLEAKLAQLQQNQAKHNQEETERKFAVRYHKVRFFERVKLERRINKLEGKQARGHALSADEQQQITDAKSDLQYVMHFPKGERYVSILKEAAEPEAQVALLAERARLRKLVKHQLAETAMIADADEGLGQDADMAEPAADAEADAFFLDEESSAAAATSSQPAALLTEATPSISNATAKIETGAAEVMTVSQHKPASPPLRLQQQQQRKRKQEPDVSEHNKVHVKAVTGIQPISTAEHHAALNADLLSTDRPGPSRAKPAQKHRASAGADAGRLSAAPVLPCKMPSQHKQRGQTMHVVNDAHKARSVHVQDQRGETQGNKKGLTPTERSRLLLHKLQQKHSKPASMQPVLKDATLQGDCLHTNGSLAESHDQLVSKPRQLHSLALKRTQNDGLLSKPDSQSKQIGSGVGHHVSASLGSTDQAVIAKAPARSRAEGGRKRRR